MTKQSPLFGPLTYGVTLGVCIGFAIAVFGLYSLHAKAVERQYDAVLFVSLGAATIGLLLGFIAEKLISNPAVASERWVRHALRPITFCSLPYLLLALSLSYFGYDKLMGGLGFWFCVVTVPALGIAIAWRRRLSSSFDLRFPSTATEHGKVR